VEPGYFRFFGRFEALSFPEGGVAEQDPSSAAWDSSHACPEMSAAKAIAGSVQSFEDRGKSLGFLRKNSDWVRPANESKGGILKNKQRPLPVEKIP